MDNIDTATPENAPSIEPLKQAENKASFSMASSKRMLLILSPFLAIVVVLVWLAILSIGILAAGRAYVEGESLWSKSQKESVSHLLRYAETGDESELIKYGEAIAVPLGFRKARLELEKEAPNYSVAASGFMEGGSHPDDIPGVISLYERFHRVSYMKRVLDIWRTGVDHDCVEPALLPELLADVELGPVEMQPEQPLILRPGRDAGPVERPATAFSVEQVGANQSVRLTQGCLPCRR